MCLYLLFKLVMLVGTKLEHVVSKLALEVKEQQTGTSGGAQVKPRDGLFWFGKPEILLRLIQFIIFQVNQTNLSFLNSTSHDSCFFTDIMILIYFLLMQNAFEMATFIWFLVRPPYKLHASILKSAMQSFFRFLKRSFFSFVSGESRKDLAS